MSGSPPSSESPPRCWLDILKRVAESIKEEEEREEGPGNIKNAAVSLINHRLGMVVEHNI